MPASHFTAVCDWIISDLEANVAACAQAHTHRYAGWDPSQLLVGVGERHVAVWPLAEGQTAEPMTIGGHRLRSAYRVLYWEHSGDDLETGTVDEEGAAQMLAIHDQIVDRLYAWTNQIINADGHTFKVSYDSTAFPEFAGQARWFSIGFIVDRTKEFA